MNIKRKRRTPEDGRAALIRAAEAALETVPFSQLTVAMVTARAGMTRSAFYHYFAGLDELVLGLLQEFEQEIRATVDPWLEGQGEDTDYRAATRARLTQMFLVFEKHHRSVHAVATAADNSALVFKQWQSQVVDYFIDKTAAFITREVASGRSRVADPAATARALILMNNAVRMDEGKRPAPDDPRHTAGVIADIWNAVLYSSAP